MTAVAALSYPDGTRGNEAVTTDWVLEIPCGSSDARGVRGPLEAHDGLLTFFDGVLHDRGDLCAKLRVPPKTSDAGLVAAAYSASGRAAFNQLRGAFVAAVIDSVSGISTVARDPLGASPLYYTVVRGRALFAIDPQTLLALPGVSPELNRAALAERLCSRWPDTSETYFAAVRRVPPGSCAVISRDALEVQRYWDPSPINQPVQWLESGDQFYPLFDRAVQRCLQNERVGVFLSGGIDSISIAAAASDLGSRTDGAKPLALSLAFPEPGCDERVIQRFVASQLNLPHVLVDFWTAVGPGGLLKRTLELNQGLAAPILNTWAPAYFSLAKLAHAAGVRTILTGSGGDEWLSVSPFLAADLLRQGRIGALLSLLVAWHRSYGQTWPQVLKNVLLTYGLRPLASMCLYRLAPITWGDRRESRVRLNDPDWVAPDPELRNELKRRASRALAAPDPPHGFYLQDVRTALEHPIVSLELEEQHQFGRRLDVRFMHPYWDADLVDVLYRLPPKLLMARSGSKALLRGRLSARFPSLGLNRQKKVVATSFLRPLLRQEAPDLLRELGQFKKLSALGVVNSSQAREFASEALSREDRTLYQAWELLNLESWVSARG